MTLEQFIASRRAVDDVGAETKINTYDGFSGFIYAPCFGCDPLVIVRVDGLWWDEYADEYLYDLAEVERRVYAFAQREGTL